MAKKVISLTIKLKDGVSGVLKRINGGIMRTTAAFKTMGKLGASAFRGLAKVGAVAMGALTASILAVGASVKTAFKFETAKVQLKALLGSMEAATARFNELREFSAKTPFQLPGILKASRLLTVFSEGALGGAKSLESIGDAAAVAGQDISDVAFWIGRAYSMLKGGKPFGEAAMRLQEMGILTAKGRDEIEKMVKAGAPFEKTFARLEQEMKRFEGGMKDLSATGDGLISTLKDNWTIAVATFGNAFMDAAKGGITTMIETIQRLVKDGTITKWAEQAKSAFDLIAETAKIIAGVRGPEARVDLFKKVAELFKASIMDAAEWASAKLGGAIDPSINTLGGMLKQLTGDLGDWGVKFVADIGTALLRVAPKVGLIIGGAVSRLVTRALNAVQQSMDDTIQARKEVRAEVHKEGGIKFSERGTFKERVSERAEKIRADREAKAIEKLAEETEKNVQSFLEETIADTNGGAGSGGVAGPVVKELQLLTPQMAALEAAIDSAKDPFWRSAEAARALADELRKSAQANENWRKTGPSVGQTKGAEFAPGAEVPFINKATDPFINKATDPFISGATDPFVNRMGGAPGMDGLGSRLSFGSDGQPIEHNQNMMGGKVTGMQGSFVGPNMMGTPPDVRDAMLEAKAEQKKAMGAEAEKVDVENMEVPQKLDQIYTILDQRLGGVDGG